MAYQKTNTEPASTKSYNILFRQWTLFKEIIRTLLRGKHIGQWALFGTVTHLCWKL
jgi:hypothetical protein